MPTENTTTVSAQCRLDKWQTHSMSDYRLNETTANDLNPCWNHNYFAKDGEGFTTYFNRQSVLLTHTNHVELIDGPHFSRYFESGEKDYRRAVVGP